MPNLSPCWTAEPAVPLDARSLALRRLIVRTFVAGGRGHLASALSLVEILRVLYDDVLCYAPQDPKWPYRDRCILSKGHGCLALYAVLASKGFFPPRLLRTFCHSGSLLGGHPEPRLPGVEVATGSLGHGLAIGIGFALHARHAGAGHRVFVIVGDGECDEGAIWEGALCASKHRLSNLTLIIDYNRYQSYGPTAVVQELEPFAAKWQAFGFATAEVDGHDVAALRAAFAALPLHPQRPTALICHTVKGKGIAEVEHNGQWHHRNRVTREEGQRLLAALEANDA
ncbi:MAG: transketolase [Candidatus Tectimicrobiota bacterium]|nr:MAG: transketolase [Candidatus Tectomicrobia bacterium]